MGCRSFTRYEERGYNFTTSQPAGQLGGTPIVTYDRYIGFFNANGLINPDNIKFSDFKTAVKKLISNMKQIIYLMLLYLPFTGYTQDCNYSYKKWIKEDGCWVFQSYKSIGIADGDTIEVSKKYQVSLPKSIKWYNESPNMAIFILAENQSITIETHYNQKFQFSKDTIYVPTFEETYEIISRFHSICNSNRFYKKLYIIAEDRNKRNTNRKDIVVYKIGCRLLLFNIKEKNFKRISELVKTFRIISSTDGNASDTRPSGYVY